MDTKELVDLMAKAFTLKQLVDTRNMLGDQEDVPSQLLQENKINHQVWLGALTGLIMVVENPVSEKEFKEKWLAHLEIHNKTQTRDDMLATLNIPEQKEAARQWHIFLEPLTITTRRTTIMQVLLMAITHRTKT